MHAIGEVEDIDSANQEKLKGLGISTTDDLLGRASTPGSRSELASAIGVTDRDILKWANCADLMRVDGIGMQFADLLEEAGVDTIPELAQRNPSNLHARVVEVNSERQLSGRAPTAQEVDGWVEQAKALPRILQYGGSASDAPAATTSGEAATVAMPTADTSASSPTADTSASSSSADTSASATSSTPTADTSISNADRAREAASAASSGGGFMQRLMNRLRGR